MGVGGGGSEGKWATVGEGQSSDVRCSVAKRQRGKITGPTVL